MTTKIYLQGETESPLGWAPGDAWQAKDGEVKRPEDVWIDIDPLFLMTHPESRLGILQQRVGRVPDNYGLRIRFCLKAGYEDSPRVDLFDLTRVIIGSLPGSFEGLYLHAELTYNLEPGIHIAWDNRPPALLTQIWVKDGHRVEGVLPRFSPPLHLNLLLHDLTASYQQLWSHGLLEDFLTTLREKTHGSYQSGDICSLSVARSNVRDSGISVGLEELIWNGDPRMAKRAMGVAG